MAIGYKLMECNPEGKLFPLFIGKNDETKIGEWIHAENIPTFGFSVRPGWHVGKQNPDAPWLKSANGTELGCYKSKRSKHWTRVWCEVEYNDNHNYDDEVALLPKKCFVDKVPEDGCYFFREANRGVWVISSDIKIIRVLSENERQKIMKENNYDERSAFAPYRTKIEKYKKAIKREAILV